MSLAKRAQGWMSLSYELQDLIIDLAYTTRSGRIVEVQTASHAHYGHHHRWCPRTSPSPRPAIFNMCRYARSRAYGLARHAGHVIFRGTIDTEAASIYFDHRIDTLYVRNDKEYWIRDWGSEGILTQFQTEHSPEDLRFLAIELDPLSRGTTPYSLCLDLSHFSKLVEIIFIVKEGDNEVYEWVRRLNRNLRGWVQSGLGLPGRGLVVSPDLGNCRLGRRSRAGIEYL